MIKAIGRLIAFVFLFFFFAFMMELFNAFWITQKGSFTSSDDPEVRRFIIRGFHTQFLFTYGPLLYAIIAFVSGLIAFRPRLPTIVLGGFFSVLVFFIAPFALKYRTGFDTFSFTVGTAPKSTITPTQAPTPTPSPTSTPSPTLLTASTAQQQAIKLYPDLAIANSPLNQEFIRRYHQYQKANPAFFNDPEWPTTLARECQAAESFPIDSRFFGTWTGQTDPGTGEMPGCLVTYTMSPDAKRLYVEAHYPQKGYSMTVKVDLIHNPIQGNTISTDGFTFTLEPNATSGHFKLAQTMPNTATRTKEFRNLGEGTLRRVDSQ